MAERFVLFCVLLILREQVKSELDEVFFNGFSEAGDKISLNGVAEIENNGILRLTNDTLRLLGHAFYSKPIQFKNSSDGRVFSFSTAFAFAIHPQYRALGGHGIAFTIAPTKELKGALPSQYLGLLNASNLGNFSNHIFAVEFDTVKDFELADINDNHVGIDINSLVSNISAPAVCFTGNSTKQELNMKGGEVIQAWIDYDSAKYQLTVKLSPSSVKPMFSILSFDVDLSAILRDTMYVGFSASTGLLASTHYLLGWSFRMNKEAESLDLSRLPSLPVKQKQHRTFIVSVSLGVASVTILGAAAGVYLVRRTKIDDRTEEWELHVGPHRYSYQELKQATRGFKDKQLLGFGGFGRVYKGVLPNSNMEVAVKRISHESKQGVREFASEISSIGRLRHKNLVQLLGWCRRRGDLLLVYDYMPNGSLDKYLFDEPEANRKLSWEQRFNIIKGVASGLVYLHEEWEQTVVHRDIKAANVLLDSEMNARLGDFGLAKLYEHGSNPCTTRVVGTLGYLAPELTRTGKPTTSSDVFAFGALMLEVACGRRPIEPKALPEELILVDWLWDRWKAGAILEVMDPKLQGRFQESEALLVLKLGLICSADAPDARPTMRQVLRYLDGEAPLPDIDGGGLRDLHDYVHSYPASACFERASACSSTASGDGGELVDPELASPSLLSAFGNDSDTGR